MTTATVKRGLRIIKKRNLQYHYVILNSNPWFSAVSDYSLQLARFFQSKNLKILYCADKNHTAMADKCLENKLDFCHLPLHSKSPISFFITFFALISFLLKQKKLKKVFVFEGREHTLACLSKLFFPFLWKNTTLVRIRGQAQVAKKRFFLFLMYHFFTDKIIFTAHIVRARVPYKLPPEKYKICYYGKTTQFPTQETQYYHFNKQNFDLIFNKDVITFFMLGRFDPIKGHDLLLEAFIKADFKDKKTQLICVGTKQNISAQELYDKYKNVRELNNHFKQDFLFHLSTADGLKKILLIEEHFPDAMLFMKNATFGVISSLGSETICRVGVEFLQAGVPVIYSSAGALPEVFADFPEFKFECNNVYDLTKKLEHAAAIYHDHDNYLALKRKSYDVWMQNYTLDVYEHLCL